VTKLLPKTEAAKLPALYATDGDENAIYPVKFFGILTASGWTWYAKEFDGEDTFFGLVTSPMCPNGELGYFSLSELAGLTAMGGKLPLVERDAWWTPATLAELKEGSS
jgi:hypothetical protein